MYFRSISREITKPSCFHDFFSVLNFRSFITLPLLSFEFLREITGVQFFRLNNKRFKKIKAVVTKLEKIYCDDLGSLTGDRSENISRLALLRSALCISKDRYLIRSARRSAEAEAVGDLLASLPKVWVWKIHCVQSHLEDFSDPSLHCCKSIRKHCLNQDVSFRTIEEEYPCGR